MSRESHDAWPSPPPGYSVRPLGGKRRPWHQPFYDLPKRGSIDVLDFPLPGDDDRVGGEWVAYYGDLELGRFDPGEKGYAQAVEACHKRAEWWKNWAAAKRFGSAKGTKR